MTMGNDYSYASQHWWPDIERLAEYFGKFAKVELKPNKLGQVQAFYSKSLHDFKKRVYKKEASKHEIDRHKITALYIKSFLTVSPFYANKENGLLSMLPNEYFSFVLMNVIFMAWNKTEQNLYMEANEKSWFIKLLNHFRLYPETCDMLSLSQIVYYIEKQSKKSHNAQ